jgi:hypothetical protein
MMAALLDRYLEVLGVGREPPGCDNGDIYT